MKNTENAGLGLNEAWQVMRDVHLTFGTPAPRSPTAQDQFHRERRALWIKEEADEILEAGDDLVGQVDGYLDVIVFALGGLVECGVAPGKLYSIVMDSQFAKLWPDGKPRVREHDGKWIKPEGWVAPEPLLEAEINKQIEKYK
jgi:hypothetical protein